MSLPTKIKPELAFNNTNKQTHAPQKRIAIVGAGLTGLLTATLLEQALAKQTPAPNYRIDIFEKSAGVGRLATRYKKAAQQDKLWQFDFGAQFFTVKTPEFKTFLKPWLQNKTIVPWYAGVATIDESFLNDPIQDNKPAGEILKSKQYTLSHWSDKQPRYVSAPKMTSWGRALANQLTHTQIYFKTRVAPLTDDHVTQLTNVSMDQQVRSHTQIKTQTKTILFDDNERDLGQFDWVIITAPLVQSQALLAHTSFSDLDKLTQKQMLAAYSLMLGWQDTHHLPDNLQHTDWQVLQISPDNRHQNNVNIVPVIGKVFIEHKKPQRKQLLPSITIHANNIWAQQHVDAEIGEVTEQMLQAARHLIGWDDNDGGAPTHIDCHRWRYAATVNAVNHTAETLLKLCDEDKQWLVIGDWCDEGRIESTYVMATWAVQQLIDRM